MTVLLRYGFSEMRDGALAARLVTRHGCRLTTRSSIDVAPHTRIVAFTTLMAICRRMLLRIE
jgi:hypothetical protein